MAQKYSLSTDLMPLLSSDRPEYPSSIMEDSTVLGILSRFSLFTE